MNKCMDERPVIEEVIVVEGKNDTKQVLKAVDAITIETRGSALDGDILDLIERAEAERGVIVLTDPDFPGEQIRKKITERVPTAKHAFIQVEEGVPGHKGSLGVEHASPETILKALRGKYTPGEKTTEVITRRDLRDLDLIDCSGSRQRREKLGRILRIGYVNGKQLQKRLQLFSISLAEVKAAIKQIEGESDA